MGVFSYLVYAIVAFVCYMVFLLGYDFFVKAVLPWVVFIIILFAPLVWMHIRSEKETKK